MSNTKGPHAGRRCALLTSVVALCAPLVGCGSSEPNTMFDDIDRLPVREKMVEVDIGSFLVPVPVVQENASKQLELANLVQVQLELFAVVHPKESGAVEHRIERNEGRIRDQVIRVCRSTTRDDLMEPYWVTLKAHLLDAVQPLLGGPTAVRRLGVRHVSIDEI